MPVAVATSPAVIASPLPSAANTAPLVAPGAVRVEVLDSVDRDARAGELAFVAGAAVRLRLVVVERELGRDPRRLCVEGVDAVEGVSARIASQLTLDND